MARLIARPMPDPLRDARALFAPVKLLKDQRQVQGVDAGAIILHRELQPVVSAFAAERDAAARRRVTGHIFQQVAQNSAEQMRIEPGRFVSIAGVLRPQPRYSPCARSKSCATPPRPGRAARGDAGATSSPAPHWRRSRPSPRLRRSSRSSRAASSSIILTMSSRPGFVKSFALQQCGGRGAD